MDIAITVKINKDLKKRLKTTLAGFGLTSRKFMPHIIEEALDKLTIKKVAEIRKGK